MKRLFLFLSILLLPLVGISQNVPKNMVLKRLDNTDVSLDTVLRGKVTIVVFWATWCKPCQNELEALADLQEEWKGKVRVVAVSIDDARSVGKVKSFVKGKQWPFEEVFSDGNKALYKALHITSIPFVMIVSGEKVIWSHEGFTTGDENVVVEKALVEQEKRTSKSKV